MKLEDQAKNLGCTMEQMEGPEFKLCLEKLKFLLNEDGILTHDVAVNWALKEREKIHPQFYINWTYLMPHAERVKFYKLWDEINGTETDISGMKD